MKTGTRLLLLALILLLLVGCGQRTLPGFAETVGTTEPTSPPAGTAETPDTPTPAPAPDATPDTEPAPLPEPEPEPEPPERIALRAERLAEARDLAASCRYDEALALLAQPDTANGETEALAREIQGQQAALVPYDGPVAHIFFHSLIVDPAKAFDGGASSEGYDLWMTTRKEFQAMLPLLEERGYMLVDYEDLVEYREDGTLAPATLLLPPGRKPLVLSVDDVCYYDYMAGDGFAERLALDSDGQVVTIVDGQETRDGDVVPILDDYVRAHPGFSYRGAKGILAVTGYEGVFGYRITDLEGEALADAQAQARAVSDRLRETGWRIASHSYTHNSYFQDGSVTMEQLQSDTERWRTRIEPVVGPTNLYISPFGMHLSAADPRMAYLQSQGYQVYCPVSSAMGLRWGGGVVIHERFNLDGLSLRGRQKEIAQWFFDPAAVHADARPTPLPPA